MFMLIYNSACLYGVMAMAMDDVCVSAYDYAVILIASCMRIHAHIYSDGGDMVGFFSAHSGKITAWCFI